MKKGIKHNRRHKSTKTSKFDNLEDNLESHILHFGLNQDSPLMSLYSNFKLLLKKAQYTLKIRPPLKKPKPSRTRKIKYLRPHGV